MSPPHPPLFFSLSILSVCSLKFLASGDVSVAEQRCPRPCVLWRIRRERVKTLTPSATRMQDCTKPACLCIVNVVQQVHSDDSSSQNDKVQRGDCSRLRLSWCKTRAALISLSVSHAVRQELVKESNGFLRRSLPECVNISETTGPLVSMFASNESVSSSHASHCKYSRVK